MAVAKIIEGQSNDVRRSAAQPPERADQPLDPRMLPLRDESRHAEIPRTAQGWVDTSPAESVRLAAVDDVAELHRFNAWANRRLLAGVRQLSPEQLDEHQDGMYHTILGVLRQLAQVEFAYLSLMRGESLDRGDFTSALGPGPAGGCTGEDRPRAGRGGAQRHSGRDIPHPVVPA